MTVTATCRSDVRRKALDDIAPGCATQQVARKETDRYKVTVEAQGKLQIFAFDSAGWVKAATPESDSIGIMESQHTW